MTEPTKPFKIIIVGAGLSGLAIAHGLGRAKKEGRASNIQVTVVERRQDETGFAKYPIRISPEGLQALQALLSPQSHAELLELSDHGLTHGGINAYTEKFSHLFTLERYTGDKPQFVHRWVLGKLLREGIDVRGGKRVVRVRDRADGREKVDVVFEDGTEERADLVIVLIPGADGLGSTLRAQLHPTHARVPLLPYLVIQFKLLAPLSALPPISLSSPNLILGKTAYSILLVPFQGTSVPPLASTEINPFTDPSEFEPTLTALDAACPEYIFVAFGMREFQGWEDLTGPAWLGRIGRILREDGADERLIRAVEEMAVPQTVGAWQITSMDESDPIPWEEGGRIVLVGDAVHAMPPQGGVGGSLALKDAECLIDVLLSSTELGGTNGPIDILLPPFHIEMMSRAGGFTRDAKRRLYLSHKTGWGVWWQRGLLYLMRYIAPLADWVLNRSRDTIRRTGAAGAAGKGPGEGKKRV